MASRSSASIAVRTLLRGYPALRREILHSYGPAGLSSYQATDDRLDLSNVLRPGALLKQRECRRGAGVLAVRSVPPQEEPDQVFDVVMAMADWGHLHPGIEQLVEVVVGTGHRRSARHDQLTGGGSIEVLQEVRQLLTEAVAQQVGVAQDDNARRFSQTFTKVVQPLLVRLLGLRELRFE